jgi:hypothetical protein
VGRDVDREALQVDRKLLWELHDLGSKVQSLRCLYARERLAAANPMALVSLLAHLPNIYCLAAIKLY